MENYPILIRGPRDKLVRIKAANFGEAKERALMKYRNRFVNYKYAKNMDLISARVEAATLSRKQNKPQYIILKGDEFIVSATEPSQDQLYGKFVNGSEDKDALKKLSEPTEQPVKKATAKPTAVSKEGKKSNKNTMATTAAPAKKAAKKTAPAKSKPATTEVLWHKGLVAKATTLRFSKSQWDSLHKKAEEHGGIQKMAHDALIAKFGLK